MSRIYTPSEIEFIRKHYPEQGADWVAEKIGKKRSQVKQFATREKIKRTNFRHSWTNDEIGRLTNEFSTRLTVNLADEMGLTYTQISNMAHKLGLVKAADFYSLPEMVAQIATRTPSSTTFEKGHTPVNKGKGMSDEIREKVKHTWFELGHEPHNTKYDGYERIKKDGYREIRISKGNFELLHRYNWEKVNRPIPKDNILRSKDGDPKNCDPDNWYLIDRASQLAANSGRDELTDKFIVDIMTYRASGLKSAIAEMPELIELKRNQLILRRKINELNQVTTND